MNYTTFHLETTPRLASPAVIIGFRGWGNALDVSAAMATYIVDRLNGRAIGRIDSDACYRYDDTRPVVDIQAGELKSIDPPGGRFFALHADAGEKDLLVLVADEPHLNWQRFSNEVVELAIQVGASAVLTLGSMFDHVLHTDRIISAASTGGDFEAVFRRFAVAPINYQGPSAIHSLILDACRKRGIAGASLWSHCPAYLQGITHHGLMMALGRLLADLVGFSLPTDRLESRWEALEIQIGQLISENPKLEGIIDQIRKKKRAGTWKAAGQGEDAQGNVINLEDFRDP